MVYHFYKIFLAILLTCSLLVIAKGSDTLQKPFYQVSLLTIAPGTEIYSLFGHTAIRIKNVKSEEDITYNYGTFDFNTQGFIIKFLRGKLPYQLAKAPFENFMYEYNETKRSVTEQVLDISQEEADLILKFLENNALPENKDYLYDFLYDNCATRVRDVFNNHLPISIVDENGGSKTFRNMLHEYLGNYPWTRFGIDLIVASPADKITDVQSQMFLPDYLALHMTNATTGQEQLKKYTFMPNRQLLFFEQGQDQKHIFTPFNIFLGISILLLVLYFTKFKAVAFGLLSLSFVIFGIGSMVILFMWFGTDHQTTKVNFNLIWLSPLYLFLPFLSKKFTLGISILLILLTIVSMLGVLPQVMPTVDICILIFTLLGLNIYFHLTNNKEDKVFID